MPADMGRSTLPVPVLSSAVSPMFTTVRLLPKLSLTGVTPGVGSVRLSGPLAGILPSGVALLDLLCGGVAGSDLLVSGDLFLLQSEADAGLDSDLDDGLEGRDMEGDLLLSIGILLGRSCEIADLF